MNNDIIDIKTIQASQQNGFLTDANGNRCLRRTLGMVLLCIGIVFGTILFFFALLHDHHDGFGGSYSVMQLFLMSGAGLLGINIFENVGSLFNKK